MAAIDLLLALPAILLSIALAARFGSGLNTAMAAAGIVGIPGFARIARASTLAVNRREFTDAARALNASNAAIIHQPHPAQHYFAADRPGDRRHR